MKEDLLGRTIVPSLTANGVESGTACNLYSHETVDKLFVSRSECTVDRLFNIPRANCLAIEPRKRRKTWQLRYCKPFNLIEYDATPLLPRFFLLVPRPLGRHQEKVAGFFCMVAVPESQTTNSLTSNFYLKDSATELLQSHERQSTTVELLPMLRSNVTSAEQKVLDLVSQAKTNKQIAPTLHISPATVKRRLENILRKPHLKNRVGAAIYGLIMTECSGGVGPPCPLELWRRRVLNENR